MYQAKLVDRSIVIQILTRSFDQNPTLNFLIRKGSDRSKHISAIAEYAFAYRRNGVWLSDSRKGVGICFRPSIRRQDLKDIYYLIRMLVKGISLRRLCEIFYHRSRVESLRPTMADQLYFWFFGVCPGETPRVSARELSSQILSMASRRNLDIYAETTLYKNMVVYRRFGFEVYRRWLNPTNGIQVWFLRRLADRVT